MSNLILPGMQEHRIRQAMRVATCEELNCEWFLYGHEGMDEGAPFRHQPGVRCGDFQRCTDPNCPCPSRLLQHWTPDERQNIRYLLNRGSGAIPVVEDQWVQTHAEGAETIRFIRERGL